MSTDVAAEPAPAPEPEPAPDRKPTLGERLQEQERTAIVAARDTKSTSAAIPAMRRHGNPPGYLGWCSRARTAGTRSRSAGRSTT